MALPVLTVAGIVAEPDGDVAPEDDEREGRGEREPSHPPHPTGALSIRAVSPSRWPPTETRRTPSAARRPTRRTGVAPPADRALASPSRRSSSTLALSISGPIMGHMPHLPRR